MRKCLCSVWRRFGAKAPVNLNELTAQLKLCPPENLVENMNGIMALGLMVLLLLRGVGIAEGKVAGGAEVKCKVFISTAGHLSVGGPDKSVRPTRAFPPGHYYFLLDW